MINAKRLIIWSIVATGISSITIQLITIREFLSQFHGNEITISLVLFCWLLFTGLGSLVAKFLRVSSLTLFSLISLLIALLPLPQIIFIRSLREIIFIHGASPGFYQIFFYIMATTSIYCLSVGFILPYSLKIINNGHYSFTSGELYITDSIGDITGGILFSFILVYWLTPFKAIACTSSFLIIVSFLLLSSSRRHYLLLTALFLVSLFYLFSLNGHYEKSTLLKQYGNIVRYVESPYGRVIITGEGLQHTLWESGIPLYSNADTTNSEERIHYPLSQIEKVKNILLISGGIGEALDEAAKYQPEHIDYVEINPSLTDTARELGFIRNVSTLTITNIDGRSYIKTTRKKYDAIIINLPDPDTFQLNRFFTHEFFTMAKKIMSRGGILSFGLQYSPNYTSGINRKKLSSVYNTVRMSFQNVIVIPGGKAYFLCRDGELRTDIPGRLKSKGISTSYIEGYYNGNVTGERIERLLKNLDRKEYINTDFEPRIMNIIFQRWFMQHDTSPKFFFLAFLGCTLFYLILLKKEEYVLFTTGLTAMGVEMLMIFAFQVIYGYIYLKIGAIITSFLLGLLPGAIVGNIYRGNNRNKLIFSDMILLTLLFVFFVWVSFFRGQPHQFYFLAFCFIFSFICGFQFPVATGMIGEKKSPAAGCIAADLMGAASGTIITGTILIPMLGIQAATIFLILIKISSNILVLFGKKIGVK